MLVRVRPTRAGLGCPDGGHGGRAVEVDGLFETYRTPFAVWCLGG